MPIITETLRLAGFDAASADLLAIVVMSYAGKGPCPNKVGELNPIRKTEELRCFVFCTTTRTSQRRAGTQGSIVGI